MVLICVLLFSLSPLFVNAALKTVIVDDQSGDSLTGAPILFLPSEAGFSQGPQCRGCQDSWCQGCALSPNASKAYGGTWRVANHFKGEETAKYLQFDFVGTAVAIYCIVPNLRSSSKLITQYAIDFRIDDELPPGGTTIYNHGSDSSGDYTYDVPVFNQTGLKNEKHKMMVRMMPVPDIDAVLLFDYATYTFDDGNPPQPPTPSSRPSSTSSSTSESSSPSSRATSDTQINDLPSSISSSSSTNLSSTSAIETSNITIDPSTVSPTSTQTPKHNDNPPATNKHRLAIILGSSVGSCVVLIALGVLLICCLRRRRVLVVSQTSQIGIRPFTTTNPHVHKDCIKGRTTGPAVSESNAHLQELTEGESVSSRYSEDAPPDYSQRGFPL
ncbi:hypothetical protein PQX77_003952 [Marasmius sp. AFHP31]|nr:hypothetical protein PQX77_003952 [Marasmius sp. AFHP31]